MKTGEGFTRQHIQNHSILILPPCSKSRKQHNVIDCWCTALASFVAGMLHGEPLFAVARYKTRQSVMNLASV